MSGSILSGGALYSSRSAPDSDAPWPNRPVGGPRDRAAAGPADTRFAAFADRFTSLPEIAVGLSNAGATTAAARAWCPAAALEARRRGALTLLRGTRRESANDNADPEHAIGFRVTARFEGAPGNRGSQPDNDYLALENTPCRGAVQARLC